jgi:hypothetical protein
MHAYKLIQQIDQCLNLEHIHMAGSMSLRQNSDFSKPFIFVLKLLILCKIKRFPFLFVLIFESKYKVITFHFVMYFHLHNSTHCNLQGKAKLFNLILPTYVFLNILFPTNLLNFTSCSTCCSATTGGAVVLILMGVVRLLFGVL